MPIPFKIEADAYQRKRDEVLRDPAASDWLKSAIRALEKRDPLDAVKDCEVLNALMDARQRQVAAQWHAPRTYAMRVHEQDESGGRWVEYRRIDGGTERLSSFSREAKRFCYRTGCPVMLLDVTDADDEGAPILMHVRPTDQVVQHQQAADYAAIEGTDVRVNPTDL